MNKWDTWDKWDKLSKTDTNENNIPSNDINKYEGSPSNLVGHTVTVKYYPEPNTEKSAKGIIILELPHGIILKDPNEPKPIFVSIAEYTPYPEYYLSGDMNNLSNNGDQLYSSGFEEFLDSYGILGQSKDFYGAVFISEKGALVSGKLEYDIDSGILNITDSKGNMHTIDTNFFITPYISYTYNKDCYDTYNINVPRVEPLNFTKETMYGKELCEFTSNMAKLISRGENIYESDIYYSYFKNNHELVKTLLDRWYGQSFYDELLKSNPDLAKIPLSRYSLLTDTGIIQNLKAFIDFYSNRSDEFSNLSNSQIRKQFS